MSVPIKNFVLEQGEDMEINMVYTEGAPPAPVDLTEPGWAIRMDIKTKNDMSVYHVYTLNSEHIDDIDPDTEGDQPDTDVEVEMRDDGFISIVIPRQASISGPIAMHANKVLFFDLFIRTPQDRQRKVMEGTIYIRPSFTRWV